jgi:large subunit ribosomal protein L2
MNKLYEIIKRPIISEKSTALAEIAGKYAFEVDAKANKHEIRDAVQQLFKVNVREVRTMIMHGKIKRLARSTVKRANWKKAIVTLQEGQKIDFFQNQSGVEMAVKTFKPTTPANRYKTVADFSILTPKKDQPKKPASLFADLRKSGGRNNFGKMTVRHVGGGHRRKYRVIDFARDKREIPATVASLEYDPNRTAYIALLNYADGEKRYILAPLGLKVGDPVIASDAADIKPANNLALSNIPVGTFIHNLEVEPGKGGKLSRSAGNFAQLMAKEGVYCQVKMPSGEVRLIHSRCRASIGQLSNTEHENIALGKAGRKRWLGVRPTNRGVSMNPIDHPHGGGEGKSSGGGHPRTPWGVPTKGYKTRNNKRTDAFILKRRK